LGNQRPYLSSAEKNPQRIYLAGYFSKTNRSNVGQKGVDPVITHLENIKSAIASKKPIRLFLDYDGTLADFEPSPDMVQPKPEVIRLLQKLINAKQIKPAIISGRRLSHLQQLIPLKGLILAGTYGLEIQTTGGEIIHRLNYDTIRPDLETLKPLWEAIILNQNQFFLEDKGWSLALHARFADDKKAAEILYSAQKQAMDSLNASKFKILPGHKFLEAAPILADKGKCVDYLVHQEPFDGQTIIYMGDDDKDEEAFKVVQSFGGIAIRVCSNVIHQPIENGRLENPKEARIWLENFLENLE
jgi:trehalose 6-phosphate phosphatase